MRKKWLWIAASLVIVLGGAGIAFWLRPPDVPVVVVEAVSNRDLEAIVSASCKIQPKRQVNISANTMGRVTRLAVEEGQRVRTGQFLLEIDPKSLEGQLQRGEAGVAAARSALQEAHVAVEQARMTLDLSRQTLKRQDDLWRGGLTTREAFERAQSDVELREAELRTREQEVHTREEQIKQEQAGLTTTRYNLSQVIISAPMDGIVTRRNIEQGENVVVGTMNNAGTVLLTIADMSILEAQIDVDETDIPEVELGQDTRVAIDAIPDRMFRGRVTEIGNSPIQNAGTGNPTENSAQATNFKVAVTLEEEVPDIRPGFTCTAEITTATRKNVLSVPIQALTVRELLYDARGALVRDPPPPRPSRFRAFRRSEPLPAAPLPEPPGHTRRETEGVFVLRANRAVFLPIKVGIAGERYFEVVSGLEENDQVITGPFNSVREIADGSEVRLQETPGRS